MTPLGWWAYGYFVGALMSLLAVIAEQIAAVEENVEQLYDDQFIETCAEWVAPYIGDLVGYRTLHGVLASVASPAPHPHPPRPGAVEAAPVAVALAQQRRLNLADRL